MSNFETFSDNTDNNLQQFDSLTIPKKSFSTKILCIFDGFGLNVDSPNNAIARAKMPNLRKLLKENFWTTLSADGESVGQEAGLVGNSEVGHMNIGGLKLVPQLSFQITKSSQNSFDLDKKITPDQLFDPKKFLENLWNEKIKISSLKKENCPISNLLYKVCKICLDEEMPGIEYITHHNYKFSGKSGNGWNENFIYLEDFFYVVGSWILPGVNLNYQVVAEMLDNRTNKLDWDYKHREYWQKHGKTETALWKYLKQAYELAGCQTEEELLNFVKNELNRALPKPKTIHLVGLFSTGCIHSDLRHWVGSIEASLLAGSEKVVLHLMTDGRDSDKKSLVATWQKFTEMLEEKISKSPFYEEGDQRSEGVLETRETQNSFSKKVTESWKGKIFLGSVGGRFFGMDRDKNWLRVWDGLSQMFNPWTLSVKDFSGKLSPSEQILIDFIQKKYQIDVSSGFTFGKIDDEIQPDTIPFNSQSTNLENQLENQIKNSQKNLENSNKIKNLNKSSNEEKNDNLTKITKFLQNITDLNYQSEKFDEMIVPTRPVYENLEATQENGQKIFEMTGIAKNDTVWLINFRSDRMKQFGQMLCDLNQELELDLTILANNSFGLKVETFLTADLDFDENINRFKKMPGYDYQEGQYYPVFKPQTVKNTLAQSISQIPKTDYKKIHFDNELNYELGDKLTTLDQNNWQNWQNINWQTPSFEFIQLNEKSATKIATKYNILELQKDLKNPESWLFGHIEMSKNKTRLDFFCLENDQYLGIVQLEKMAEGNYELFISCDYNCSDLGLLLEEFSNLVFENLEIQTLHYKQTEPQYQKYQKLTKKAGFEFEKLEMETGCVYSKKSQKKVEIITKKQKAQSGKTGKLENQKFCTQLHIAETEKYNHVTYFFNGGQDKKWDGEDWIVIPSNKVASHAEIPEMKAKEVTDKILEVLGGEKLEQETKLEIREMTENDLEEVKKIITEGWQDSVFFEVDLDFLKQNCERSSFPALTDNNYQKFVCIKNDQLIGYLAVENKAENSGTFWIGDFYIKKEFRKQEVGQFLFDHGLKFIQQNGGQEVFLYLDDANLAATRFYTKVGFISVKKSEFEWLDKDGKVVATNPEQLMRLEMSQIRSKILKKESVEEIQYAKINSPKKLLENTKANQNYQIRKIQIQDCHQVWEIIKNGWLQSDQYQFLDLTIADIEKKLASVDYYDDILNSNPENPENKLVLIIGNKIIGYSSIMPVEKQIMVNDLYIQKEFQNLGLGKVLFGETLEKAQNLARNQNLSQIQISYGKNNQIAQSLYQSFGFMQTNKNTWNDEYELTNGQKIILENLEMVLDFEKNQVEIDQIKNSKYDYIIVNYANPDMVGHTGDIPASIKSMEFLDAELGRLLAVIERDGHEMIIIADHGNMEFVGEYQKNGKTLTDTEHNPSPVPCIFVGNKWKINNPNLENTKEKFLQNLENLNTQKITNLDLELVAKILKQKNQVDLSQQENWLSHTKIDFLRSEQLPLWASGALLLGL